MRAEQNREIRLKRRPEGAATVDDFELAASAVPKPAEGQALVQTIYFSVDPYMRGRMNAGRSYVDNFEVGGTITGGSVGQVIESAVPGLSEGDYVSGFGGWTEYFIGDAASLTIVDPELAPLSTYLGVMGMPGATAYFGLLDVGQPREGETIFVSAASGAVGSIVCQIGKIKGCRVVGSAGSPEKVAWLENVAGIDAALNYKAYAATAELRAAIAQRCPAGIDVYFENVGGMHLEATLSLMNQHGRIPLCGMISGYNADEPMPGPSNLGIAIGNRLRLEGFIVSDFYAQLPKFQEKMGRWIADGQVHYEETIVEGVEHAPEAFTRLFTGEKMGKMLVKV
jgi:NADPH-dependent curcumin reductase CurA